jgi:hypothetical protein
METKWLIIQAYSSMTSFFEILLSLDGKLDAKSIMGVLAISEYHCILFALI